jgi:hypothetical protein
VAIVSSEITDYSSQKHGPHRARFKFTLSDGREVLRGPVNVSSHEDAELKRVALEPSVLSSIQAHDANEAVHLNVKTSHNLASVEQVQYVWLKSGFDEDEHYKAYAKIKDIGEALLSLGLSDEQYASMLNVTVEDATATRMYWEFLDDNKIAIEAYSLIAEVKL